jgi:hypothetical protein
LDACGFLNASQIFDCRRSGTVRRRACRHGSI